MPEARGPAEDKEDVPEKQLVGTQPGSRPRLRKKLGESAPLIHLKTICFI